MITTRWSRNASGSLTTSTIPRPYHSAAHACGSRRGENAPIPAAMTNRARRESIAIGDEHEVSVLLLEPGHALVPSESAGSNCVACSASMRDEILRQHFGKPATSKMYFSGYSAVSWPTEIRQRVDDLRRRAPHAGVEGARKIPVGPPPMIVMSLISIRRRISRAGALCSRSALVRSCASAVRQDVSARPTAIPPILPGQYCHRPRSDTPPHRALIRIPSARVKESRDVRRPALDRADARRANHDSPRA